MALYEVLAGSGRVVATWRSNSGRSRTGDPVTVVQLERQVAAGASAARGALQRKIAHAFLPQGYPQSVSEDYLPFQLWDLLQGRCSYVRGSLTTNALLKGVGVGKANATALSATYQFFLKDFSSMLLGMVLASQQGTSFDSRAKEWRLTADILNDFGMALELATAVFPNYFLLLVVLASCCRSITGLAAGATRASLTQHFALNNNAADIAAKVFYVYSCVHHAAWSK